MFENFMITPQMVVSFIKNTTDFKKLATNIFQSQQVQTFVTEDLGLNYEQLKSNLITAFSKAHLTLLQKDLI